MTDATPQLPADPVSGERVNFVRPDGETVSVPVEKITDALQRGYQPESADHMRQRVGEQKYGGTGGEVVAGLLGAARGTTFGISDRLAVELGVDPRTLAAYKEFNPTSSTASELGAVLAQALLTKRTPVGAVARGGAAVEAGAARALAPFVTSTAGRVFAKGAAMAAGAAVEGIPYGVGQLISEDALGQTPLTAQNLAAYAGLSSLLSGAAGGVFGVGGELARAGVNAVTPGLKKSLSSLYGAATGSTPAKGLGEAVAKTFAKGESFLTGANEGDLLGALQGRHVVTGNIDQVAREFADLGNESEKVSRAIGEQYNGEMKIKNVWQNVKRGNEADVALTTNNALQRVNIAVDEVMKNKGLYGPNAVGRVKKLADYVNGVQAKVSAMIDANSTDPFRAFKSETAFEELDKLKRFVGQKVAHHQAEILDVQSKQAQRDIFEPMYEDLRQVLMEPDIWGVKVASMQRTVNEKYTKWFERLRHYQRTFIERVGETGDWRSEYAFDPGRAKRFLESLKGAEGDLARDSFERTARAQVELAEAIDRHVDLTPDLAASVSEMRKNADDMLVMLKRVDKDVVLENQRRAVEAAGRESAELVGAMLGGFAGGPAGSAIGAAAAGLALRPARTIKMLAMVERMSGSSKQALGKMSAAFAAPTRSARDKAMRAIPRFIAPLADTIAERNNLYDAAVDRTKKAATNQVDYSQRLTFALSELGNVAPKTAMELVTTTQRAHAFLLSKVPKSPRPTGVPAFGPEWQPSDADKAKFLRYVRAVEDPLSVVEDLLIGSISREGVESLRVVYPDLYASVRTEVLRNVGSLSRTLDYRDRVALSVLLDAPLDPSMSPGVLSALKQYGSAPQPQGMKPLAPTGKETLSERTAPTSARLSGA